VIRLAVALIASVVATVLFLRRERRRPEQPFAEDWNAPAMDVYDEPRLTWPIKPTQTLRVRLHFVGRQPPRVFTEYDVDWLGEWPPTTTPKEVIQ